MTVRCLILQCPYNVKECCSATATIIDQQGQCAYIKTPRWNQSPAHKEEVNVITLAKREEGESDDQQ